MYKLIACIITLLVLSLFSFKPVYAYQIEAGASAMPKFRQFPAVVFDYRVFTLQKFFKKYNSPLTPYSNDFIRIADYYGLDYRIVPSISGVESTFGKHIPQYSYNAYGWAGGKYNFKSWPDSILVVSKTLKNEYINKGANSIEKISRIYAPPSTTWGRNVSFFMRKIDILPLSFDI